MILYTVGNPHSNLQWALHIHGLYNLHLQIEPTMDHIILSHVFTEKKKKKIRIVSGPMQFKPTFFQGQLYMLKRYF